MPCPPYVEFRMTDRFDEETGEQIEEGMTSDGRWHRVYRCYRCGNALLHGSIAEGEGWHFDGCD